MDLQTHLQRTPAASDAEIRAFLHPLLKAGRPPTYKTMRATLGGGFSRLARIKKQIERELAGGEIAEKPADDPSGAAELVATLEALFDKQGKALEEWERRSLARLEAVPPSTAKPAAKATKVGADAISAQADRLETVERRLLAAIDKLQALTKAPAASPARVPAATGELGDVPPAWARQAAAAATAALDGRLQSIEETVRDAATGARGAFDLAAEIAREVASDASLQLQVARSTLTKAVREEFVNLNRSAALESIQQALRKLSGQMGDGFATAAAIGDRRAVAIRDVILAMIEIEGAQCEMFEGLAHSFEEGLKRPRERSTSGKAKACR